MEDKTITEETSEELEILQHVSEEQPETTGEELTEEEKEIELLRNSPEAKWYVIHTYVGYENVAKENLENVIEKFGLEKRIFDIVIPVEDVIEEKNGKKKLVSKKITPNYIFVKMIYGDDLWHNVTRTRGITGFTGPKGRPLEITEDEIRKMRLETISIKLDLTEGDQIEVISGPLSGMVGKVTEVAAKDRRAKVLLEMFGRETSVDLDFSEIRKID